MLERLRLSTHLAGSPYLLLQIARQNRLDLDVEGIGSDIQEKRDRIPNHGLGLFQAACLV
jgi:hypothetical protein